MTQVEEDMNTPFTIIDTHEVHSRLDNPDDIIVDIRPLAAYNGWRLNGEARGGHIRGAVSFPFEWTQYKFEIQEMLYARGINRKRVIILYGYDEKNTQAMATMLHEAGYEQISIYNRFGNEWVSDPDLPMDQLSRYQHLVYPDWVNQLINGRTPLEYHGNDYVICHAHYGIKEDYDKGHIPGAIELDTLLLESPETWNRRSPEELKQALESKGIRHDTTVILYGRFSNPKNEDPYPGQSAGHLGAIRCAAIMLYAGVKDVRVLNGGIGRWKAAGFEITTEERHPEPVSDFDLQIPAHPGYFIDTPEAKEFLTAEDANLVCIRSWEEFIGNVSGYNYIEKKGRIPGAVFGNCGSDAYHMENYRNLDLTIRQAQEVADNWKEAGVAPDKRNAFYCGTGWRGSEAFFNAWLMGWPRVAVYDGGWFEWSNDPDNPIANGTPNRDN